MESKDGVLSDVQKQELHSLLATRLLSFTQESGRLWADRFVGSHVLYLCGALAEDDKLDDAGLLLRNFPQWTTRFDGQIEVCLVYVAHAESNQMYGLLPLREAARIIHGYLREQVPGSIHTKRASRLMSVLAAIDASAA